jgi:hypothetical protein
MMNRLFAGVVIACLVAPGAARADEPAGDGKSEVLATSLSLGGTLAGAALVAGAYSRELGAPAHDQVVPLLVTGSALLVVGPSFGNWYARKAWSTGLGLRLAGAGAIGLGGVVVAATLSDSDSGGQTVAVTLAAAGAAAFVTGTVLDIIAAPRAVRRYNEAHAARRLSIAPVIARGGSVEHTGFAIAGTF